MTHDEWIAYGVEHGYCGPPVCASHDGVPTTEEEFEDPDLCFLVLRIYEGPEEKARVEEAHAPSREPWP